MRFLPEHLRDKKTRDAYIATCRRTQNRPLRIASQYAFGAACLFAIAHLMLCVEAAHPRVAAVAAVILCMQLASLWHRAQLKNWPPLYWSNIVICITVLHWLPCGYFAFEALWLFLRCHPKQSCFVWDTVLCAVTCVAAGTQAFYRCLGDLRLRRAEAAEFLEEFQRLEDELEARKNE